MKEGRVIHGIFIGTPFGILVGVLGCSVILFMSDCEEHRAKKEEVQVGAMVSEGIEELVQVKVDIEDLQDRVDALESDVSVTDQSVEAAWETVNDLDRKVEDCCEEGWR